jgi:hypothetical protein
MKHPSKTTCFPRLAVDEHSDCQTGTVALSAPTPNPRMNRPTTNWASWKLVHWSASPTKVNAAATKMIFRRPSISPTQVHNKAPKRAPIVKVATTAPWTVDLWFFSAPLASMVLIAGKWSFQSRSDSRPPTPDWLYPNNTNAGKTTSNSWAIWSVLPESPMIKFGQERRCSPCPVKGGVKMLTVMGDEKTPEEKTNMRWGIALCRLFFLTPQYLRVVCAPFWGGTPGVHSSASPPSGGTPELRWISYIRRHRPPLSESNEGGLTKAC